MMLPRTLLVKARRPSAPWMCRGRRSPAVLAPARTYGSLLLRLAASPLVSCRHSSVELLHVLSGADEAERRPRRHVDCVESERVKVPVQVQGDVSGPPAPRECLEPPPVVRRASYGA